VGYQDFLCREVLRIMNKEGKVAMLSDLYIPNITKEQASCSLIGESPSQNTMGDGCPVSKSEKGACSLFPPNGVKNDGVWEPALSLEGRRLCKGSSISTLIDLCVSVCWARSDKLTCAVIEEEMKRGGALNPVLNWRGNFLHPELKKGKTASLHWQRENLKLVTGKFRASAGEYLRVWATWTRVTSFHRMSEKREKVGARAPLGSI